MVVNSARRAIGSRRHTQSDDSIRSNWTTKEANSVQHHINRSNTPHTDEQSTPSSWRETSHNNLIAHQLPDTPIRFEDAQTNDPRDHVPTNPIENKRDICKEIKAHLTNSMGHNRVRRYFSSSVSIEHANDGTIEIVAGDRFTLDMIDRRLGDAIRIAAQFALGTTTPTVRFRVDASRHQHIANANAQRTSSPTGRSVQQPNPSSNQPTHPLANRVDGAAAARAGYRPQFPVCPSLEDFLVGSSNRLAYESIKQVLQSGIDCPPVFVHGSCGVGKTHLLRGATRYARSLRPGCKVRYTTGEAFTNSFVNAIRTRTVEAFQKKYRGLDLLCIDDIHMMAGKQATQHNLLEIFNKLSLGGAKIILASDAHPREISRLDQALASRFSAGLVVKVEEPDAGLSIRLVEHIAAKRGVFLDQPAIRTIVDRVGNRGASVRDLEGAVVQIQAVARLMDNATPSSSTTTTSTIESKPYAPTQSSGTLAPTMMHIRKALSLRMGDEENTTTGPIALDTIISRICDEMTVSKSDLRGKGRQKKVVMARELIVHTARNLTSKSFPEIAYSIGRPNHSTVITAAKRFNDRVADKQLVDVGCPHDGIPASELAQIMATRSQQTS